MKYPEPDFRISDHGNVFLLHPLTPSADEWVQEHINAEAWQRMGKAIAVDHRYITDIAEGIVNDGLSIE